PNCAGSGYLQEQAFATFNGITLGWVKNWWSSHCNSNWESAQAYSGYHMFSVNFDWCNQVVTGGKDAGCPVQFKRESFTTSAGTLPSGTTSWYTDMFYSPSGTSTRACASF